MIGMHAKEKNVVVYLVSLALDERPLILLMDTKYLSFNLSTVLFCKSYFVLELYGECLGGG